MLKQDFLTNGEMIFDNWIKRGDLDGNEKLSEKEYKDLHFLRKRWRVDLGMDLNEDNIVTTNEILEPVFYNRSKHRKR